VVGYDIDNTKPVGKYLYNKYGHIQTLLRETKKYETPLGAGSWVFANVDVPTGTPNGASCPYSFTFTQTINNISQYSPSVYAHIRALLKSGDSPISNPALDDMIASMQQVPIDLRLFQDGAMIQHLLSDYGSNVTRIGTLGRGN
jgi:hypothetical protein